jgi:type II secretory pathway component PulF
MYFKYKSLNSSGQTTNGRIEAPTRIAAEAVLESRNEMVLSIHPQARNIREAWVEFIASYTKVRLEDLVMFTRQLATMFRMGIPLLRSLDILKQQTEHPALRKAISEIYTDIENGSSLCNAFRKHPKVFPAIYCSMLAAGELCGNVSDILNRLGDVLSHEAKIKKSIRGAVQYPIVVLVALSVAFVVLLTFVIPKFVPIFESAGAALPLPTIICIKISDLLRGYGGQLLAGLVGVAVAAVFFFKRDAGRLMLDRWLLQLPLVGKLLVRSSMARFASLFSMMQYSGVLVLDIVRILQQCMGNVAMQAELVKLETKLQEGSGISGPLNEARYFTKMMVNMVAVGEESGNLDEMLDEVSKHYDEEVEYAVKKLIGGMGSILTVVLAVAVGFFAMAVYLPMWNMTEIQMDQ